MQRLKSDFEANGGSFKEYRIGDLFEIKTPVKRFNANAIKFGTKYPYVVRTGQNNGIRAFLDEDERYLNEGNTLSFGQDTATIFYQEKAYFTGDKIKVLKCKICELNRHIACYFLSVMGRSFSSFQWGETSFKINILESVTVLLPTKADGNIDFDYMQKYIAQLEAERVAQLEAYLKAAGLENASLTEKEQKALIAFRSGKIEFSSFRIGDLFDIHPTKSYKMTNCDLFRNIGKTPVITNTSVNNGVSGYINLKPTENGGIITYSDTTTSDGIFYQPFPFVGYSHVQGLYPKNFSNMWNEKSLLYFVSLFKNAAGGRFDYANKFNREIASEMIVILPINENNLIDFNFIEAFISAQQKLVIKDVVAWKDKVIHETQNLINS